MSDDPFNRLPIDAEFCEKLEKVAKRAAEELGCYVLLAVAQEGGKIMVFTTDNDEEDKQRDFYKFIDSDIPFFLMSLASIAKMQDKPRTPEDLN